MEVVGAVASIAQLLTLCVALSKAAKGLWESYSDAPEELGHLANKIDLLRYCVEQIDAFGTNLTVENLEQLLPSKHRIKIISTLEAGTAQLGRLKSFRHDCHAFRTKIRWALLDKSKTTRILKVILDTEHSVTVCLAIAQGHLQTENRSSLRRITASQQATTLQIQSYAQGSSENHQATRAKIEEAVVLIRDDIQHALGAHFRANTATLASPAGVFLDPPPQPYVSQLQPETNHRTLRGSPLRHNNPPLLDTATSDYPFDLERIKNIRDSRQIVIRGFWGYGDRTIDRLPILTSSAPNGTLNAHLQFGRKRHENKFRAQIGVLGRLFGARLLVDFDLAIRIRHKAWTSPSCWFQVRMVNIRPSHSHIFQACWYSDIKAVKLLLESGAASINDVCENGYSLLWYAVRDAPNTRVSNPLELVRYLIECGCDPNLGNQPPFHYALRTGQVDSARALLRAGTDLYSDTHPRPDSWLCGWNKHYFQAGVDLLCSEEYWNWWQPRFTATTTKATLPDPPDYNILAAASAVGSLEYVMKAVDVLRIPVSPSSFAFATAAKASKIEVLAVLLRLLAGSGASVRKRKNCPPGKAVEHAFSTFDQTMLHYLYFRGVSLTGMGAADGTGGVWSPDWFAVVWGMDEWRFQELEGVFLHVLMHAGRDSEMMPHGEHYLLDACQYWDCSSATGWGQSIEWSLRGCVRRQKQSWMADPGVSGWPGYRYQDEDEQDAEAVALGGEGEESRENTNIANTLCVGLSVSEIRTTAKLSQDEQDSPHHPHRQRRSDDGRDSVPFDDTTLFYESISTPRGRFLMSRFPMTLALCNALQLAGYRAEMDDGGDVWFEEDDSDPYYDAREYQLRAGDWDGVFAHCAICQNPEKHWLGYVLRRTEVGERYIDEFRARRKTKEGYRPF